MQSPPTIALKTIMQMLTIPCYFPRNGRRAPCGRSNCFPVMWKNKPSRFFFFQRRERREGTCTRDSYVHTRTSPVFSCIPSIYHQRRSHNRKKEWCLVFPYRTADTRGQRQCSEPRKCFLHASLLHIFPLCSPKGQSSPKMVTLHPVKDASKMWMLCLCDVCQEEQKSA